MNYNEIAKECETLKYRDKLRLAQLLIQIARREEEIENPANRNQLNQKIQKVSNEEPTDDINSIQYVMDRITKLQPAKKKTLINSINAMYQFQGGISEKDLEKIIKDLEKRMFLKVEQNNRVTYLN